ncbi:DUF6478 family protein [Roseivivax sediminis]|uniref:Uncharacterized protein n=1 Tax=Roseivivax sediminis TaxID=936889 RepID=A0A1I1U8I0_9RHOB|nr:DUF6478 family protein [Roseivivax sediminis]SFD65043.1 hypothetical protein SAMN04515678_102118 [Roseivivax sediminis]
MAGDGQGFLDRIAERGALRRWRRLATAAPETDLARLRGQRTSARRLKRYLDDFMHVADGRLALPANVNHAIPRPHDADWAWRPELWSGPLPVPGLASVRTASALGSEATLFHDCPASELILRQIRNTREADLAAYGLRLDVFRFDGSYLSLAVDLPQEAAQGLKRRHLIRLETIVEMETPLEIFVRLNVQHGPNVEQIVRELPLHRHGTRVEFDLAYTRLKDKRVDKLWTDIIFEGSQMNQVVLRDLTFSRRPRAEL